MHQTLFFLLLNTAIDCHSRTIRPLVFLPNNLSAIKHREFVSQAIEELLANKCIQEHDKPTFCVNPLTVAEGKKLRLVIDLRHVNQYLVKPKFKYEDLRSLSQVLQKNSWFFTWDLKSGYHHVDITAEHHSSILRFFLGFSTWHAQIFYVYCFTFWLEHCLFLFYENITSLS